ncbi:MAG: hypothetical protein Q9227_006876 [Pyrenula ochraceoflavens]
MARPRKKKRTHVRAGPGTGKKGPKSMVIRMGAGEVGTSLSQLVKDFRLMMEPDTASRLRERRANKLKDYVTMAGPLGVTHLFLFSHSKNGNVNLRIALTPRGPTLHFRIDAYSLCRDVQHSQKRPLGRHNEHKSPPLLVMNNFSTQASTTNTDPVLKQLETLTTTIFQSMFPAISPQSTPLSSVRRCLLLNRELDADGTWVLNLRHYAITTRQTGIPRRIRRLDVVEQRKREGQGKPLPNLGKLNDVSEYVLDPAAGGYTSASETEVDTDAEVEVREAATQKVLSRKDRQQTRDPDKEAEKAERGGGGIRKLAIKPIELGPRLRLRMVKVEEGVCEGRVMWHEFVQKSKTEEKELDERWKQKRKEKEERRRIQRENVEKKKQLKANTKANTKANSGKGPDGEDEEDETDEDEDMEDYLSDESLEVEDEAESEVEDDA